MNLTKHGYATQSRVVKIRQDLIKNGEVSQKQFQQLYKKNLNLNKRIGRKNINSQILELVRKGVSPEEIANCLSLELDFVHDRQRKIFAKKNITKVELSQYKEKRSRLYEESREKAIREIEMGSTQIAYRELFFELAKAEVSYGNDLLEKDINVLGKSIIMIDDLLTTENLKIVIMQYVKLGDLRKNK